MSNKDFSYAESLCQQYQKPLGKKKQKTFSMNEHAPYWVELIHDLVFGAGYSYSRIAYRIAVSPSTIQKLATHLSRKPRMRVLQPLINLHFKVFQGQYVTPRAQEYWQMKQESKT